MPHRGLGNYSLIAMAGGMLIVRGLIRIGALRHPWWDVPAAGFEAGTIGGLADWYAVTALFHEIRLPPTGIRLPFLTRHSNIILRNRARITDNIADMVENRWLSPQAIGRQLERHDPADELIRYLDDPSHMEAALDLVRRFLHLHATGVSGPEFVSFLERLVRDQLGGLKFARPLGNAVRGAIERGDHELVWTALLDTLAAGLADRNLHAWLTQQVRGVASSYARNDLVRLVAKAYGELTGAIDYALVASKILQSLFAALQSARENPHHPIREKLDQSLLSFSSRLAEGDPTAVSAVEVVWNGIRQRAELSPIVAAAMDQFSHTVADQTTTLDTPLMRFIRGLAVRQLDAFRNSPEDRQRLSRWTRQKILALVSARRHLIGDTVRTNLIETADTQWSGEIQQKVGDDLQWIRVNGAMVGFLAGIALALCKHLLAWLT